MSNYCILRFDKKATIAAAVGTERHNNRTARQYKGQLKEEDRIIKIATEYKAANPKATFSDFFKSRTANTTVRKNAVKAVEVLLSFSPGAIPPERLKEWAGDCYKFLCNHFGAANLYSCYLHLESSWHIHALLVPIDDKGKLSAAYYLNGKEKLQEWQTAYYKEVGYKYGLERGKDKAESQARHKSLKEYRAELDEQSRANETILPELSGYRAAFGIPSAAWERYGVHTLSDFVNGKADAHNALQATKGNDIDRGRSR